MSSWYYIGEFFLFSWLFSKLGMYKRENDALRNSRSYLIDENSKRQIVDDSGYTEYSHDAITTADDNYNGDYDKADDLDDLDIFMRNKSVREYGNKSHLNANYINNHDWNSGNYNQSFDDFHEEPDDYDLMDDF
ncbi:MAG: hypothetical protein HDR94_08415 [Bacteroides sp.]|nr:hypothetical protein [Bacteroides sp.]